MGDEALERAGDLAGEAAFLRFLREGGSRRVDDSDQGQAEFGRQPLAALGLAEGGRSPGRAGALGVAVLSDHHTRDGAEPGDGEQQPVAGLALAGSAEVHNIGGGVPQHAAHAGPAAVPAAGDRCGGADRGAPILLERRIRGLAGLCCGMRGEEGAEDPGDEPRQSAGREDPVDDAVPVEVLGGLHAVGKGFAVDRRVDPRAQEAKQGAGFGDGDVPERAPARHHPAGRGVTQVHQVRQAGPFVRGHCGRDGHHGDERGGALLHPGAAGGRPGQQGNAFPSGAFDGGDEPVGRVDADRAAEEGEIADDQGHPVAADPALAGDDRLVGVALRSGAFEVGRIRFGPRSRRDRLVPGTEAALVPDESNEPSGRERCGHEASFECLAAILSRITGPCSSSVGGARWPRKVTSCSASPGSPKKRSGGPGRVTGPRLECSTSMSKPCEATWSQA
ncbi:MAG: hypothetical protein JWP54_1019 [Cryobacterium sp.]|jgi:hypothetical protein|nr:hypothetical protein [Cryobacterium sp.]